MSGISIQLLNLNNFAYRKFASIKNNSVPGGWLWIGQVNRTLALLSTQKQGLAKNISKGIWMTYEEHNTADHDPLAVLLQLIWIISCICRFVSKGIKNSKRNTWNKSLNFYRVLILWIKATASFKERRNHNAYTNNMWNLTGSSCQS